ncbi:universal stress protein [Trinickia violacea]|uniref:Universal stress protein n=1 Tax=Trinickia violacea TaxID=2571746 RepID=A0A4P8J439_9BURK|nr:universal stress protein [Trinickia violacea]QCP53429.1 universal stress protein [Trinickia violacea]
MYERIMVAVDGSQAARLALDEASKLAEAMRAEVLAVCVVAHSPQLVDIGGGFVEDNRTSSAAADAATKALDEARELFAAKRVAGNVRAIDSYGESIAQVLTRAAEEFDAKLIVMGTHGHTGMRRLLLGSVAESLLRETTVPLLLVKETPRS